MKTHTIRFLLLVALIVSVLAPSTPARAATFTVTNLNNSGAGSLFQAITDANAAAGADTITFSVNGTILLGAALGVLPMIVDVAGLTIDGTGQTVTISGNHAVQVMFVGVDASLTLNHLTIANGHTAYSGGGISNGGTLTITNSTFSGNSTPGAGGGIYNNGGTSTITNSTFSGNSATYAGANGGGVKTGGDPMTLRNTILANSPSGGNCGGMITDGGNNLDDGTTCYWGSDSGSMSSTNPLLGALANNGGPTQTFALLTGSPAIDGVTFNEPNSAPSADQRGVARPYGVRYDIGSYEYQLPFSDDPLTVGATTVKAVHITELRTRIDAIRIAKGLLAYGWADSSLDANASPIRAQHIIDLRTALDGAYVKANRTPPTYATDPPPSLAPGVAVKAAHIAEIRAALVALE